MPLHLNEEKVFKIKILGRMLEHLGVQMYKKRNTAIAELVANAWDAGATDVFITAPSEVDYSNEKSEIIIEDNGSGMDEMDVQSKYMIVGRNRRKDLPKIMEDLTSSQSSESDVEKTLTVTLSIPETQDKENKGRKVMGRKGIGKLAGFGIATNMRVQTWRENHSTEFLMKLDQLKIDDNEARDIDIRYETFEKPPEDRKTKLPNGTRILLSTLKHKSPIEIQSLKDSLSRRFSRTVRGQMSIYVNDELIDEPNIKYKYRFPETGDFEIAELSDGNIVLYEWRLAETTIQQPEMRGFTIQANGKTAQAPNFFFDVEGTATGQHGTKVLTGTIEADYLDIGIDDETDFISTDRQEIDWETDEMQPLYVWGQRLVRDALYKNSDLAAKKFEEDVLAHDDIKQRIDRLGSATSKQIKKMLKIVGKSEPDPERTRDLADALVRAYEYEHFHDSIEKIENIEDPEMLLKLLEYLHEWQTIESLAILEVVKGRLAIVEKFHQMTVTNAPETANRTLGDNMHDLIAGYPWLLNHEWQILNEEKTISKQLQDWNFEDIGDAISRSRYDFIGLADEKRLIVIDIKRAAHPLELDELHRLENYKTRLRKGTTKEIIMVMIYGGTNNIDDETIKIWKDRPDALLLSWDSIYEKTKSYYEHYKAILEGDVDNPDFSRKTREVSETRKMLASGKIYRSPEKRAEGLGVQDLEYN